jgi:NADP-dependent aldehyde dehydrogenase
MTAVVSIDPRTASVVEVVAEETSTETVHALCEAAAAASPGLEELGRRGRAEMLRGMADALEVRLNDVVSVADRETGIGRTRLTGEFKRTCYQVRLFAEVLDDGGYVEATIDHAGDTAMGPRPDLRRMLVPIGPVGVFGSSNFPLAFSVPGGDTISALAAGSPVVIKAHPSHPSTSKLCFELLEEAASRGGAPPGTVAMVYGQQAGADLVAHPAIKAVGFTGSLTGGQALMRIIASRPEPIPFYGEMSSLNPVIVTPGAAAERGAEIGAGLVASYTVAAGQLCTKPGLALIPAGPDGDVLMDAMMQALVDVPEQVSLNEGIWRSFMSGTESLRSEKGVEVLHNAEVTSAPGYHVGAQLIQVEVENLASGTVEEHFGPVTVNGRYSTTAELDRAISQLPSSLTATIHSVPSEAELVNALSSALRERAGRLVYDGFPTGVSVAWAQHHGGPWPATNSFHTSVGPTAIRRFLRPVTWQDAPAYVLPTELREEFDAIPRRVDGQLRLANLT